MTNKYPVISRIGEIFLDNLVIIFSFLVAIYIRNKALYIYDFGYYVTWQHHLNILIIILITWGVIAGYLDAYAGQGKSHRHAGHRSVSIKSKILIILRTVSFMCPIVLAIAFLIKSHFPGTLIIFFCFISFFFLSVEKLVLHRFSIFLRDKGITVNEVLVLGVGDIAEQFINSVSMYPDWGIRILGLIGKDPNNVGKEKFGYKIIGYSNNLMNTIHMNPIDELIIALPAKYFGDIEEIIIACDKEGIPVRIISPLFNTIISKARTDVIHGMPVIEYLPVVRNDFEKALKRVMDILFALGGLIVLAPLFIILAILIKLDSPGPVFYKWNILGLHKRKLTSYKFRTMVINADKLKEELQRENEMVGAAFKMKDDPRITGVGKWLRKYSLDELPQLWSVFKGDLTLVGPRPPLQTEIEEYEGWHKRKLSVKPGITCLWQVSGRNEISDFNEWMKLDLKYIDEWSFWLDLKILIKTFFVVFKGTGR